MRKVLFLLLSLQILFPTVNAQGWDWVKPLTAQNVWYDKGELLRTPNGNLLALLAEPWPSGATRVICCTPAGDTAWSFQITGLAIQDIAISNSEQVYFVGNFDSTIWIQGTPVNPVGGVDFVIGALDQHGVLHNYRSIGTAKRETATCITAKENSVAIAGSYIRTFTVDTVTVAGKDTQVDAFVLLLDTSLHALRESHTLSGGAKAISLGFDRKENLYLLGRSAGPIALADTSAYISEDGQFLVQFDSTINFKWLQVLTIHHSDAYIFNHMLVSNNNELNISYIKIGGAGGFNYIRISTRDEAGILVRDIGVNISGSPYLEIDHLGNIWVAGRDLCYGAHDRLSIIRISPTQAQTQIVYSDSIFGGLHGFVLGSANDFYLSGNCFTSSSFDGHSCLLNGAEYVARFESMTTHISTLETGCTLFPNPSRIFDLTVATDWIGGRYSVVNTCGEQIQAGRISSEREQLNLSSQSRGIYFLRLESGAKALNKKLIVD